MLYSDTRRVHYQKPQLMEVICQLRFPTILTIGANPPVDFQEAIRDLFPQYVPRQEELALQAGGGKKIITNYNFLSADNRWKLNLTENFIALSTVAYPGWENFGQQLDRPLAQFIELYHPAYFERIGLRYMNIFSRKALALEGTPWRDLIEAPYLGPMGEEDVDEKRVHKCALDLEMSLDSTCSARIHAGPGMVRKNIPNTQQDPELKYILDLDLSAKGQLDPRMAAATLEMLHGHSTPIFQGAITDTLHSAMEPI